MGVRRGLFPGEWHSRYAVGASFGSPNGLSAYGPSLWALGLDSKSG